MAAETGVLERVFKISERRTSVRTEVIAGVTTFMTMAYILFVNPSILSEAAGGGQTFPALLTATAVAAAVMTLAMGLVSNYPFAIASGMGLNAVVAFQLVGAQGLTYGEAMGVIVTEGILITILVLTGFREAVLNAIPTELKKAIGAGIGLFIALIGFANAGVVVAGQGTPVARGDLDSAKVAVFVVGLLITAWLVTRRMKGALLIGIVVTTALAIIVNAIDGGELWSAVGPGVAKLPTDLLAAPDFSLFGEVSFAYWGKLGAISAVLAVFTLMLADFFDTMGTAVALGDEGDFLDDDERLPGMRKVLLVDSVAAAAGGLAGASSATTYIESAAGIEDGGRTGLTSVVVGLLFAVAIFFSPIAAVIPPEATAPALIMVGFLMLSVIRDIDWNEYAIAIPSFLTIVVMPFNYSITDGIGWGFVTYSVIHVLLGRVRDLHWMMLLSSLAFAVYFAIDPIRRLLGVG